MPLGIRPVLSRYRIEVGFNLLSFLIPVFLFACYLEIHLPLAFILFVLHAGFVLGLKRPEKNKSGTSGSAARGHRVRRERRAVGSHPELQEEPQLQHPGQVVRSGTCSRMSDTQAFKTLLNPRLALRSTRQHLYPKGPSRKRAAPPATEHPSGGLPGFRPIHPGGLPCRHQPEALHLHHPRQELKQLGHGR